MSNSQEEEEELYVEEEHSQRPSTSSRRSQVVETYEEYELKEPLVEPGGGLYTTGDLYEKIQDRSIDLRPGYQRNDVWTDERRIALIDSILRNFYIPPLIFSVSKDEDGSTTWICMDGKQRLTSIKRFMDGEIPHKDHITHENLFFKHNPNTKYGAGKKKKILPQRYREAFMRKKLFCVHYHSLDSTQEQVIFQRVQLGMPLTVAENLNVNFSPRATLARELVDMVFPHDRGIAEIRSIPITTTRSKGYQIMVQVLCVLSRWDSYDEPSRDIPGLFGTPPQTAWLQQTITRHYAAKMKGKSKAKMDVDGDSDMEEEEYEEVQPVPVTPEFRERMKAVADVLVKMAKDPRCAILFAKHAFSQTVSPMAFIGWFLLAYHGRQTLSEKQLLNLCLLMRIQLHKKHPGEVKTNSRCGETLIIFITEALKDPDGLISKGEETGLFNWAGMRLTEDGSIDMETSARPSRKRKQRDEEHESEDPKKTKKSRVANRQPTTTAIPSPTPPKRVSRKVRIFLEDEVSPPQPGSSQPTTTPVPSSSPAADRRMRNGTPRAPSQPKRGPSQSTTTPVPVGSQATDRSGTPKTTSQPRPGPPQPTTTPVPSGSQAPDRHTRNGISQTPSQPQPGPSQPTTTPVPSGSQAADRRMRNGTSHTPSQPRPDSSQSTTAPVSSGSQAAGRSSPTQHGTQSTTPTVDTAPTGTSGGPTQAADIRSPSKPPPPPHSSPAATKSSASKPPPPAAHQSNSQGHQAGPSPAHTTRQIHQPMQPAPQSIPLPSQSKQHVARPVPDQSPLFSTTPSMLTRHHTSAPAVPSLLPPPPPPRVRPPSQGSQLRGLQVPQRQQGSNTAPMNTAHQQSLERALLLWHQRQLPPGQVDAGKFDELRQRVASDPVAIEAYHRLQQQPGHVNASANSFLGVKSQTAASSLSQRQQQQQQPPLQHSQSISQRRSQPQQQQQQPPLQRNQSISQRRSQPQQFIPQGIANGSFPRAPPTFSSHPNNVHRRLDPYKQPSQPQPQPQVLPPSVPLPLQPQPRLLRQVPLGTTLSHVPPVPSQVPPSLPPAEEDEEEDDSFIPWTIPEA